MGAIRYPLDRLVQAFRRHKVLTLSAMMEALGTATRITVFRKLDQLPYRASYSHAGKYYTVEEMARWDGQGLWAYQAIRFSRHGTLLDTLQYLIDTEPSGWRAQELEQRLGVRVHNALSDLHRRGRVARQQMGGAFVYVSTTAGKRQLARRRQAEQARVLATGPAGFDAPYVEETLPVFLSTLSEKQRRLYAGFESLKLGRGGDAEIAHVTGLNIKTVARGRRELLSGNIVPDRIRASGAGRPSVKKNRADRGAGTTAGG
jgi:hypothetical protein